MQNEGASTMSVALVEQPLVLVVDDELHLRNSLSSLLGLHGFSVVTADGGRTAIELLQSRQFDLVLLDLFMADVDGHQVMDSIIEQRFDTCVIVVSGDISIDSAISALRRGACDFLRKPYEPDELLLKIENALIKRRLEKENKAMNLQLGESERWYRYMVNSSPDIIYTLDANGRFTFLNDRVEPLLGYCKESLIGQHYSALIYLEDLEPARYILNEKRAGDRASRNMELRVRHNIESKLLTLEFSSFGIYEESKTDQPTMHVGTYGVAKDVTERKKAEQIISYQAYHDQLTGLANRILFKDHLDMAIAQAKRNQKMLAVMFLDMDRFKVVNDTLGHVIGDSLLKKVASRLKGCLREGDTLARQGGDEFTLLLPQIDDREDAMRTAEKMIKSFDASFQIDGHELYVSISIGIALYPVDGESIDTLIKNADIAMYDSKAKGRNRYQLYSGSMNVLFAEKLSIEMQMRKAIDRQEFHVFYQPQIRVSTGRISGMEALVRWSSPLHGSLSPLEFIPLAEETGLILPIGEFVLKSACKQVMLWKNAGLPPLRMAVNISSRQIEQDGFCDYISQLLQEYHLDGSMLELEVTEGALLNDGEHIIAKLNMLASMGIKIALDDFGTGYSSLSYLQKFPIDTIKIDQSFVRGLPSDPNNVSIVTAICAMAQGLKMNLIAEGVEKADQLEFLHSLSCNEAQGFLFSKPLPGNEITRLLMRNGPLAAPAFYSGQTESNFQYKAG
jgi:diguanylate cyclase (GGDEF)-like protein/PAS domain S-box-containing protein